MVVERGGARLVRIPCFCYRIISTISTLVRALMPCYGLTVASLNHLMNGITRWVIPIASDFACTMCNALEGKKNGAAIRGCTRERGNCDIRGTETFSVFEVSLDNL